MLRRAAIRVARRFVLGWYWAKSLIKLRNSGAVSHEQAPLDKAGKQMAKRWYSVSVLSNFEKKIAEQIRTSVIEQELEADIDEVLVPTEEVIDRQEERAEAQETTQMQGAQRRRRLRRTGGMRLLF